MTEMPGAEDALSLLPGSTPSEMFPVLTSAQQARILAHGQRRTSEQGEIVVELNQQVTKVFVVMTGQLHALQVANNRERVIAICNPGMFTGELTVLTGRRGLVRIRATEKSELIEIEREALQALVEADSELSDIFLRAFIPRVVCTSGTLAVKDAQYEWQEYL
ncbi:MAG TPA: cyclic nucleotide-binding domain-containing protein [Pyrinomonadaceae bacterium]|nr:cyclic nucleotide-binding domain-containing protein [Pyrinomonadaceae bacterium]